MSAADARAPKLAPAGEPGRIRLVEMLASIAPALHKPSRSAANAASPMPTST
jgi:hypothetical protein